jgi:hypothetical protein
LLTTGFVHLPAAHAMPAPEPAAATAPHHCHDDAQAGAANHAETSDAAAHADGMLHDSGLPGAGHHCKSGICACACAHGFAAMTTIPASAAPPETHNPLLSIYRVPAATGRPTPLFRPPI